MAMQYSSADMLGLVAEINVRRMAKVMGKAYELNGGRLSFTEHQIALMQNARTLHRRYVHGDYRHTEQEFGKLRELMELLLTIHARNHNQPMPVMESIQSLRTNCTAKKHIANGTYAACIAEIESGRIG